MTAGQGGPPLPSPSPRSPSSSTPRSGLASRAPRGPPGRPQNRPGRAAPAPERLLHRSRDADVVLPPRKQLPSGARPGTSPPRPASCGRGCARRSCRLSALGGPAHRAQQQFRLRRPGGERRDGARGGAGRTARGAGRGDARGDELARGFQRARPPTGAAIGQQRARFLARTDAGRGRGAGLRRR